MKYEEKTMQQIERLLHKVALRFPVGAEDMPLTDIHLQVKQDSGELMAFNDDDDELNRCIVEEWIDAKDEDFYTNVQPVLKQCIANMKEELSNLSILKPYSFVLEDDEKETVADLYLVDDDTIIVDDELMKGLDDDLDKFLDELLKRG